MDLEGAAHGRFQQVGWTDCTGSTNADVREAAQRTPSTSVVLFADEQTAGRGRRDRQWTMAHGGGLLVSFYVPWPAGVEAHAIPTALGVATVSAIASVGRHVHLKWPNDIVAIDDRKIGGMLSEAVTTAGTFAGVICGLGCNVAWPDREARALPGLENAVSLDSLGNARVDRDILARSLIEAFDHELDLVQSAGVAALYDRYRSVCTTIGREIRVDRADGTSLMGTATDVSIDGSLLVLVDGSQHRVDVGDVVHLRPAAG